MNINTSYNLAFNNFPKIQKAVSNPVKVVAFSGGNIDEVIFKGRNEPDLVNMVRQNYVSMALSSDIDTSSLEDIAFSDKKKLEDAVKKYGNLCKAKGDRFDSVGKCEVIKSNNFRAERDYILEEIRKTDQFKGVKMLLWGI